MNKQSLEKKYNEPPERKEARRLLWRWGRVREFCAQTNSEILYFQERVSEVAELRARSEMKVTGGKTSDPTSKAAEDLEVLQKEYQAVVDKSIETVKSELEFKTVMDGIMFDELSQEDRDLLRLRYIKGWSWIMVAAKMCMAERTARNREQDAIDKIATKITVRQKCAV